MIKNQRNVLELALIHVRLDNVLQGDGWGIVDPLKELDSEAMFDKVGDDIREFREMSDEQLLAFASKITNEPDEEGKDPDFFEEVKKVPSFETYAELYAYVSENLDGGDLVNQSTLDVLYWQIIKKEN